MKPTCCDEVIENTVLGKKFYVCTGCKREVIQEYVLDFTAVDDHQDNWLRRALDDVQTPGDGEPDTYDQDEYFWGDDDYMGD